MEEFEADVETHKNEEALKELKWLVKELQQEEDLAKRREVAATVKFLTKENLEVRGMLAMLRAIPPLVVILDLEDLDSQIASLYMLLNLEIGNDANIASFVNVGFIHKMINLIESPDGPDSSAVNVEFIFDPGGVNLCLLVVFLATIYFLSLL
ncbi:Armadillo-type fold [Sesbania bispinosa]|nr:Armadillo-type fold [Sesbania bispinosa]